MNALRHGLLSKCVLLPDESKEIFDLLLNQHLAKLEPADGPEHSAVEEMVACIWRQRRLWAVETRLLANAAAKRPETDPLDCIAGAFSDLAKGPELNLIHRYEGRLHRMHQRALQNLFLLSDSEPNLDSDNQNNIDPLPAQPTNSEPDPGPPMQNNETNPSATKTSSINPLKVQSINRPPSPRPNNRTENPGAAENGEFSATNWTILQKKQAG